MCDETGQVLGAVNCATRRTDQAGLILWLHAGEDLAATRALVKLALNRLGRRTVHAFELPIPLSLGMRGLPVRSRPVTRKALEEAGFSTGRQWRYLHRSLPHRGDAGEVRTYPIAEVTATSCPTDRRLRLREPDGAPVGEAVVGEPVDGIGVLWWIAIDPQHRGRGLGANLAEQCCSVLAANGAHEVIAYLDEDATPGGQQCDTTAASHLLGARGFREIGRLASYSRQP
ncbi:GNAT family N-acetyltransferase [Kitasatospora griseola]|uniref:GNAT family N-acetyltransferase n=1 Tax=Kitasatospora griseola TaxID=2064 RepID=UPI003855BD68